MTGKHWYQDGWWVLFLVVVGGFFGYGIYTQAVERAKPLITLSVAGQLQQPFFGSPSLEITVWHQYPAALRNVRLFVSINEDPARRREHWVNRQHSFEAWSPNRDQAMKFSLPLKQYDPQREIAVSAILFGKSIKMSKQEGVWLGSDWKPKP
jgi:hypothetical protein